MVTIDFQPDMSQVRELRDDIESFDAIVEYTAMETPVRLRVGVVELLERTPSFPDRIFLYDPATLTSSVVEGAPAPTPWLRLPLLVVTLDLELVRKRLLEQDAATWHLPEGQGTLYFKKSGEELIITSTVNESSAQVSAEMFVTALVEFEQRVRGFLSQEIPELRRHPFWVEWLAKSPIIGGAG